MVYTMCNDQPPKRIFLNRIFFFKKQQEVYICMAIVITEAAVAADMIVHPAKCTKLLVLSVIQKLKFLSSLMGQDRSIAGIVTRNAGQKDIN